MDPDQIARDPDQIDFSRRSSMILVHSVCFHEKRGLECIRIYDRANTFSGKQSCVCEKQMPLEHMQFTNVKFCNYMNIKSRSKVESRSYIFVHLKSSSHIRYTQ